MEIFCDKLLLELVGIVIVVAVDVIVIVGVIVKS